MDLLYWATIIPPLGPPWTTPGPPWAPLVVYVSPQWLSLGRSLPWQTSVFGLLGKTDKFVKISGGGPIEVHSLTEGLGQSPQVHGMTLSFRGTRPDPQMPYEGPRMARRAPKPSPSTPRGYPIIQLAILGTPELIVFFTTDSHKQDLLLGRIHS